MSELRRNVRLLPRTLVGARYRLIAPIGEGAMGVVWSAVHEATQKQVALKLILGPDPELRRRLLREARACGAISHENVVQIHDVGETDAGDPFLVMELLRGETLAELLVRRRNLAPAEAAAIGRDIARALAAAHEQAIIHRDLKPANVFLHRQPGADTPVVKVLDFGVSKQLLLADGLETQVGGLVGSPLYMSPEQTRGERDIDVRSDVWSLGVVLYEMLTGERPFGGDPLEIRRRVLTGDIPAVSSRVRRVDPDLDRIVSACLTRPRDARLGPAAEIAVLLDRHATSPASSASRPREPIPAADPSIDAPASPTATSTAPLLTQPQGPEGRGLTTIASPTGPSRSRVHTARLWRIASVLAFAAAAAGATFLVLRGGRGAPPVHIPNSTGHARGPSPAATPSFTAPSPPASAPSSAPTPTLPPPPATITTATLPPPPDPSRRIAPPSRPAPRCKLGKFCLPGEKSSPRGR